MAAASKCVTPSDLAPTSSCCAQTQPWHGFRRQEQTCRCIGEKGNKESVGPLPGRFFVHVSVGSLAQPVRTHMQKERGTEGEGIVWQVITNGVHNLSPSVIKLHFDTN